MSTMHIEVQTPKEHFILIKKDHWAPIVDWARWAAGKRVLFYLKWTKQPTTAKSD